MMEGDQPAHVQVREHVPVHHDEGLVDARFPSGEGDRTGGVERLRFDRVAQGHPGAAPVRVLRGKRVRPETERQHHLGDTAGRQRGDDVLDHRPLSDREQRLGDRLRERAEPGAEPADQHHGPHD
jgi:hypothetical protein